MSLQEATPQATLTQDASKLAPAVAKESKPETGWAAAAAWTPTVPKPATQAGQEDLLQMVEHSARILEAAAAKVAVPAAPATQSSGGADPSPKRPRPACAGAASASTGGASGAGGEKPRVPPEPNRGGRSSSPPHAPPKPKQGGPHSQSLHGKPRNCFSPRPPPGRAGEQRPGSRSSPGRPAPRSAREEPRGAPRNASGRPTMACFPNNCDRSRSRSRMRHRARNERDRGGGRDDERRDRNSSRCMRDDRRGAGDHRRRIADSRSREPLPPRGGGGGAGGGGGRGPRESRTRVYIQHLPKDARQEDIERYFGDFGHVLGSQIIRSGSGPSEGTSAIIRYGADAAAQAAVSAVDGRQEFRRGSGTLRATFAKANPKWD